MAEKTIGANRETLSALNNAVGSLLRPVGALAEVAGRAGGSAQQAMQRIATALAADVLAAGTLATNDPRETAIFTEAGGRSPAIPCARSRTPVRNPSPDP